MSHKRPASRPIRVFPPLATIVLGILACDQPLAPPDRESADAPQETRLLLVPLAAVAGAPIAIEDVYATAEGVTLDIDAPGLMANDLDPDGSTFIVSNYLAPTNGTVTTIVTSGHFVYVPDPGFTGTDQFQYSLTDSDGNTSDPATVTIQVLPDPNRAPIGVTDHYGTLEGATLTVDAPGLMANDLDVDGDAIIVSNFLAPTHGTVTTIVTSGHFVYEPAAGFTGTDQFQYSLADDNGVLSSPVTVHIDVLATGGSAPIAIEDAFATTEGVTLDIAAPGLMANDLDPDGSTFIVSNYLAPTNGTITTIVTSGHFVYVPDPGFTGTDQFQYSLTDSDGNTSDLGTVTIEVLPDPNRAPIGVTDHYGTLEGATLTVDAPGLMANDLDPDGDAIIVSNFNAPTHGTVTTIVTSGHFVYEPAAGFTGTDQFQYSLADDNGVHSSPVYVYIEVISDNVTPPEIIVTDGPIMLWPPNHKYVTLSIEDLVTAVNDQDPDLAPEDVRIVSVSSDEVDNDGSDGKTINDIVIAPQCRSVDVRAERVQGGNGRVYVIQLAAEDAAGNVGVAYVRVHVPAGRTTPVIEDAPANVVTGTCGT